MLSTDQIDLLRRFVLSEQGAIEEVMSGGRSATALVSQTEALVRIVTLISVDSEAATLQWAVDIGLAAGLEDDDIFHALFVVAPLIGVARLASALPNLMSALGIEIVEG